MTSKIQIPASSLASSPTSSSSSYSSSSSLPSSSSLKGKKPAVSTTTAPQGPSTTSADPQQHAQQDPQQQDHGFIGTQCLFPFPGQNGAPFFDRKNITQFLTTWEDLTLNWPEGIKIRKIPPYCKSTMGKYIRMLPSFEGGNWVNFKVEVLEEFKDDDEEQQKYTVAYLRKYVQQIRKSKDADYRAFILDFTEKSRFLINARKLSEYRRVTLFLHAFSHSIGNKLCKRCNIDLDDPDTTDTVFPELKREALDLCVKEESQMQKLRKQIEFDFKDDEADVKQRKKEQERKKEPKKRAEERKDNVDDLADMMKDLKIFQLEKQLAELAKANQKGQNPTALPYYPPNQYGNRQYPPNQRNMIRGCYFDGGAHSRETCEELQKALARGDVHKKGPVLFLGREDANSNIRVPIPTEDGSGKIMWQQEWVMNELMKKESQALGTANSVTWESGFSGVSRGVSCMSGASGEAYSGVSRGASSKGKGKANFHDDDDQDDFPVEFYNRHPVIRTTAQEKLISAAVDKMEAQIP